MINPLQYKNASEYLQVHRKARESPQWLAGHSHIKDSCILTDMPSTNKIIYKIKHIH